ncbi:ABC transporter permease [Elongatibacter sediminis]|uniref:FtsX-like permease family protein n=1 Tax=Elongatibacter sediminis TaxID=3119006 RepID=A0AAW9RFK4_9GAMM
MKYLAFIWSNLRRSKTRTALTMLSVMAAFVLFGYLTAIRTAFGQGIEVAGLDRLIVRHRVSIIQLLNETMERDIERIEGVADATHLTWFGGVYQKPSNFFAQIPVKPEEYLRMFPELLLDDAEKQAWLKTRAGAVIGRGLAERFGWKVGDRVPIRSGIWSRKDGSDVWEFDIVGIYDVAEKGVDDTQMLFHYDFLEESRQWGSGLVGWYVVRIEDPQHAAEIAAAIDDEFANAPIQTKTEPEGAFAQGFANQIGDIGLIMAGIVSAVFFTILLVTGNTMAHAVRERTNEFAVLKAIGFTDRAVLGLVLGESVFLAVMGGGMGLALAWFVVSLGDPSGGALPGFYIPGRDLVVGLVLVLALALAAGIVPALQARRLRIADALRR